MNIVSHDMRTFFGLLLKKNGYVLEQLFSHDAGIGILANLPRSDLRPCRWRGHRKIAKERKQNEDVAADARRLKLKGLEAR